MVVRTYYEFNFQKLKSIGYLLYNGFRIRAKHTTEFYNIVHNTPTQYTQNSNAADLHLYLCIRVVCLYVCIFCLRSVKKAFCII